MRPFILVSSLAGTAISMLLQELLTEQVLAFHTAILDSCHRSRRPEQTDAVALRLRTNAVSMTKVQLAMVSLARAEAPEPEREPAPEPPPHAPEPDSDDHVLTGDALLRFVSRRLDPAESPHDAWQQSLRDGDDATRRFPRAGFRSPPA